MANVWFVERARGFFLLNSIETTTGAHPNSCAVDTRALSMGLKWPEREAYHSPLFGAEVKNGGVIPPLPICYRGMALNWLSTGTTSYLLILGFLLMGWPINYIWNSFYSEALSGSDIDCIFIRKLQNSVQPMMGTNITMLWFLLNT
jgi:hypothetical protein